MRRKLQAALKEFELMDFMSLEEIEQAEEEKLQAQLKLEQEKANQPPTPTSNSVDNSVAIKSGDELIVI